MAMRETVPILVWTRAVATTVFARTTTCLDVARQLAVATSPATIIVTDDDGCEWRGSAHVAKYAAEQGWWT